MDSEMISSNEVRKSDEIGKYVQPQALTLGYDLLSDDLQFLSGMAVPLEILTALETEKITKLHDILYLKGNEKKIESINKPELKKLQQTISNHFYNSVGINSLSKIIAKNKQIKYYSTGIDALDTLINGKHPGIPTQSITSFIGASSSGKTLILMQVMSVCVANGGSAVFIDTNNEFDAMRLYKILSKQAMNDKSIQSAMERIDIYSVCTLHEIDQLFKTNKFKLKLDKYDMIIIDNFSLRMIELQTSYLDYSNICKLSRTLKHFAKIYNLAVITSSLALNQKYRSEFWINSSDAEICRNYQRFVDQEIHLMLTPNFGKVMPVLTKSYRQITLLTRLPQQGDLMLDIEDYIMDEEENKGKDNKMKENDINMNDI